MYVVRRNFEKIQIQILEWKVSGKATFRLYSSFQSGWRHKHQPTLTKTKTKPFSRCSRLSAVILSDTFLQTFVLVLFRSDFVLGCRFRLFWLSHTILGFCLYCQLIKCCAKLAVYLPSDDVAWLLRFRVRVLFPDFLERVGCHRCVY